MIKVHSNTVLDVVFLNYSLYRPPAGVTMNTRQEAILVVSETQWTWT